MAARSVAARSPHLRRSPFTGLRDLRDPGLRDLRDPWLRDPGLRDPRSGLSLVEVLVSILLLFIIFCSWAAMNNIQAVRKESFRYAAVEKAAGILDAMMDLSDNQEAYPDSWYRIDEKTGFPVQWTGSKVPKDGIFELWPGQDIPVGCSIFVSQQDGPSSAWTNGIWCTVSLYDMTGGKPTAPYEMLKTLLERQQSVEDP